MLTDRKCIIIDLSEIITDCGVDIRVCVGQIQVMADIWPVLFTPSKWHTTININTLKVHNINYFKYLRRLNIYLINTNFLIIVIDALGFFGKIWVLFLKIIHPDPPGDYHLILIQYILISCMALLYIFVLTSYYIYNISTCDIWYIKTHRGSTQILVVFWQEKYWVSWRHIFSRLVVDFIMVVAGKIKTVLLMCKI